MPTIPSAGPRLAACLLALLVAPGCGFGGGPDPVGLTGTWEGVVYDATTEGATRYPIEFRLTDTGTRITGTGFVDDLPEGRLDLDVYDGLFAEDLTVRLDFLLSVDGQGVPPFNGALSGRLTNRDPGTIEGSFSGRGELGNGEVRIEITSRGT